MRKNFLRLFTIGFLLFSLPMLMGQTHYSWQCCYGPGGNQVHAAGHSQSHFQLCPGGRGFLQLNSRTFAGGEVDGHLLAGLAPGDGGGGGRKPAIVCDRQRASGQR